MNEVIVLEWTRYGRLYKREIERQKTYETFKNIQEHHYVDKEILDKILIAISKADNIRWYENYNDGSTNAIKWENDKEGGVVPISWVNRGLINQWEELFITPITYTYKSEGNEKTKTLILEDVYNLFYGLSSGFKDDNKYSKVILKILPNISGFAFNKDTSVLSYDISKNLHESFEIPRNNTIILEILRKLVI